MYDFETLAYPLSFFCYLCPLLQILNSKSTQKFRVVLVLDYDTTEEFNVDWKAECDQLNLAHETKTNASAHLYVSK